MSAQRVPALAAGQQDQTWGQTSIFAACGILSVGPPPGVAHSTFDSV